MKYVAIKLKDFDHWIWFEKEKTTEALGCFCGTDGWGKGGARTSIKVKSDTIVGMLDSDELQYI